MSPNPYGYRLYKCKHSSVKAGGCTRSSSQLIFSTKIYEFVTLFPFSLPHPLFSKVFPNTLYFQRNIGTVASTAVLQLSHSHSSSKTRHKGSCRWNAYSFSVKDISVSHYRRILLPVITIFYQLVLLMYLLKCDVMPFVFYLFMYSFFQQMFTECPHMLC